MTPTRTAVTLLPLLAIQLALVGIGVFPQVSARLAGDEITLRVEPLDPIDPFRGAYVTLDYPDLRPDGSESVDGGLGPTAREESGTVFVTVREQGDVWVAEDWSRSRPEDGTYLRCSDRDWQTGCGIESWFLPQDEAKAMEQAVSDRGVVATVRVDGRGNAALVDVQAP